MIRLNRWWYGFVALVVLAALFVDAYGLIYRFGGEHKGLGQQLSANPHIGGFELYLRKGLDLQGGTELTIAVCQGPNNPPGSGCRRGLDSNVGLDQAQKQTITVLQQRVNKLGVSESTVQAQGNDRVLVQLPGVDEQRARQQLGTTARLSFATAVPNPPGVTPANMATDAQVLQDQQGLLDPTQAGNSQFYPVDAQGRYYHWKIDPSLKSSNVASADVGYDQQLNQPSVLVNFDSSGASEWQRLTTAAFAQPVGTPPNLIAIFLDNRIITAPQVNGVQTNQAQITGGFTQQSAGELATKISSGALPADIVTVQSTSVSATLGQDAVRRSFIAGAVGMAIVILFMIGYYRFSGLLAGLALLCYAAIVVAIYKVLGVTVSLAGLAGFVLSVGMAVDANVLIFERTRDELRHGRAITPAVESGFKRAWPAIRDSNISTMIACAVLWYFGTSVVKGFALTLFLGVAVSMFSAILITQSLLLGVLRWKRYRNPKLYTDLIPEQMSSAQNADASGARSAVRTPTGRFDVVHSRNKWFAGSLVVIIPGILAIMFWGFRLGLDFAGGVRLDVSLTGQPAQSQVQTVVDATQFPAAAGGGNARTLEPTVQAEAQSASASQYSIRMLNASADQVNAVVANLKNNFGSVTINTTDTVGPTIASELVRNAIILVLLASALIALYLAFVFRTASISRWRFSLCTFLKLLHDVFVLAGIWAILGHFSQLGEVDSLFVTALLTSVSFSIHDTIVVFDRIRENLRSGPRLTFSQTINLSTMQTMTRSLNTALTVVFVLLALILFGGDSIRGFVLALLIGIVTGTYSSIFNASTLLVAWQSLDRESSAPAAGPRASRRIQPRSA